MWFLLRGAAKEGGVQVKGLGPAPGQQIIVILIKYYTIFVDNSLLLGQEYQMRFVRVPQCPAEKKLIELYVKLSFIVQ